MTDIETVCEELRALGYAPEPMQLNGADAVIVDYRVEAGRYQGGEFRIAVSFQEGGYLEYPPHFLHVRSLPDARLPVHSSHEYEGATWSLSSVPPSDFWDGLLPLEKTMKTFFQRHLTRIWNQM